MLLDSCMSILYSDTLIPDIFVTEYLPSMDGDWVKIYVYCVFLSKHNKKLTMEDLSKNLGIDADKVKQAFAYFESVSIIKKSEKSLTLVDLKEKEIKKVYRAKLTSTPEEAALSNQRNKKRNETIYAINNTFFQGVMSPAWYTDIDAWFDRYKFDEDVMYMLFQHCSQHKCLQKNYIMKVADNWYSKNIKNSFDLDNYSVQYQKFRDIKMNIIKKLKLGRNLTEYEDEYIEKWVIDFKYDFEIIELALKKTTAKTNPNIKYIHAIINGWYEKGLKNKEDIMEYEKNNKPQAGKNNAAAQSIPQHQNFEQREYGDEYYNEFFTNVKKQKKEQV